MSMVFLATENMGRWLSLGLGIALIIVGVLMALWALRGLRDMASRDELGRRAQEIWYDPDEWWNRR